MPASQFLNKLRKEPNLRVWLERGIAIMDERIVQAFPILFGQDKWKDKMQQMPTATTAKLLTHVIDVALEAAAEELNFNYRTATSGGASEMRRFDCILLDFEVENKLALGGEVSVFATGSKHTTVKVDRILCVKLQHDGTRTAKAFAAAIDMEQKTLPDSAWNTGSKEGKENKGGFTALKIRKEDAAIVFAIIGEIKLNRKWLGTLLEPWDE